MTVIGVNQGKDGDYIVHEMPYRECYVNAGIIVSRRNLVCYEVYK